MVRGDIELFGQTKGKGEALRPMTNIPYVKCGGHMPLCFAATGTLYIVQSGWSKEGFLQILQLYLKPTARQLKYRHNWVFQQDKGPHY